MNLSHHALNAAELASLPMDTDDVHQFQAMVPVTATPATLVAAGAGVVAGAGVIGAAAAGAAIGDSID